jgi:dihydrofolate reductase
LHQALSAAAGRQVMVIGGSQLYRQALPQCTRIHLTRVWARLEGDTWFPPLEPEEFDEVSRRDHPADERHAYAYSFLTLERR